MEVVVEILLLWLRGLMMASIATWLRVLLVVSRQPETVNIDPSAPTAPVATLWGQQLDFRSSQG